MRVGSNNVRVLLLALAIVAVVLASCSQQDGSRPGGESTAPPSSSTTDTRPAGLGPLGRAYLSLSELDSWAFSLKTWDLSEASPRLALTASGARDEGWIYLNIPKTETTSQAVEIALLGNSSYARLPGEDWEDAAAVFTAHPDLQTLPLENPAPVRELTEKIAAEAQRLTAGPELPAFAPPAPDGGAVYTWTTPLTTEGVQDGTVKTFAWLAGTLLVRLDRETLPAPGSSLTHTYTVITYSDHAGSDIVIPVPGSDAGAGGPTSTAG